MLPQFGFAEFLMVAIVALIVVGPRDLPVMMRRLGQFVAKGRAMANEFRSAFDDIAKQAELEDLREQVLRDEQTAEQSEVNEKTENPSKSDPETEGSGS